MLIFSAIGVGLLPWTIWLSTSLNPHHETIRWDLAWSGFDTGLALIFIATAVAAHFRSMWIGALSSALGTLLVVDAWFDVVLESHADELRLSILLALLAELPMAAFCFWIAFRAERFHARAVKSVESHLPAAGESAT